MNKKIEITQELSAREWCRVLLIFEHVGKGVGDAGDGEEPWVEEDFWNGMADIIRGELIDSGLTAEEIEDYDIY